MHKYLKSAFLIISIAFLEFSCATVLSGTKQQIRLNSSPDGAKVVVNGKDMGLTTPCIVELKRKVKPSAFNSKNEYHYMFKKEGYGSAEYIDFRKINTQVYYNACFWFFCMFTTPVDFITGASYRYNQSVFVNLSPMQIKEVTSNGEEKLKNVDKTPPIIKIFSPDFNRGFKQVKEESLKVSGLASDESGIFDVVINGVSANLEKDGSFKAELALEKGNNKISIVARDKKMNTASESFYIERVSSDTNLVAVNNLKLENGTYHALIIGIQDYKDQRFPSLEEPLKDAQKLYNALIENYLFDSANVILLQNPGRDNITQALENYFNKLTEKDNLLIFYAGHGYWDEKFKQGYWLPADAQYSNRGTWLSNSTIRDYMRAIGCKHDLLITDACFAGGIFKSREAFPDASKAINELYRLPSRKAMTSGALNQVPDKSVFLEYLIKRLHENQQKYMPAEQLFASFKIAVINNSSENQVPQYGEVKETGDEGGDFIFIRR